MKIKKIISVISLASLVVLLSGCGKATKLTCSASSEYSKERTIECEAKNGKIISCKKIVVKEYETEAEAIDHEKNNKDDEVVRNGKEVKVTTNYDNYNGKSYNEVRRDYKKGGYICK